MTLLQAKRLTPPLTITKKILARAAGKPFVESGEFIEANVDRIMANDITAPLAIDAFRTLKHQRLWDPDRIILILDHDIPPQGVQPAMLHKTIREFVAKHGIRGFYDIGRGGICHQVMPEKGHVLPGECIVGADSHTCTYGALGAFATGIGSTDAAAVFATGKIWLKVPEEIRITVHGMLRPYTYAKDLILHIIGSIGADGANYKAVEFTGPVIHRLSVDSRLTLCNMAVEMGAKNGIIQVDDVAREYLKMHASNPYTVLSSDSDANYEEEMLFNVDELEPQVACPDAVDNVKPISKVEGVEIQQAFLGSCTNARLEDLRIAANIIKGQKVKDGVRLIVTPASQDVYHEAVKEGLIQTLLEAGAFITGSTCGACLGRHQGIPADDEVVVSTTNRNYPGRMGNPKAKVYLASPATVAASAITGKLTHVKNVMT